MMGYFVLLFIVRQIDLPHLPTSLDVIPGLVEDENPGSINATVPNEAVGVPPLPEMSAFMDPGFRCAAPG